MMERIYLGLFLLATALVRTLPKGWSKRLFLGIAALLYRLDRARKKVARTNLEFALGDTLDPQERERIVRYGYDNLALNLRELIFNLARTPQETLEGVQFESWERLAPLLEQGKPLIFITAHFGNWEMAPLSLSARGCRPMHGVGRPLGMERLDAILQQSRERFGVRMTSKQGALKQLIRALSAGEHVGLVVDQNTKESEGVLVEFFGKQVRHTPSAALLARRFELPIVPAFCWRNKDGGYTMRICEPIFTPHTEDADADILASVQAQAAITESIIRERPQEWFWFHKRFKNRYPELYA